MKKLNKKRNLCKKKAMETTSLLNPLIFFSSPTRGLKTKLFLNNSRIYSSTDIAIEKLLRCSWIETCLLTSLARQLLELHGKRLANQDQQGLLLD